MDDMERVWLVERTSSNDEQDLIVYIYASLDGRYEFRKELSGTDASDSDRETSVSLLVKPKNLTTVDKETRQRYVDEVTRIKGKHEPSDAV